MLRLTGLAILCFASSAQAARSFRCEFIDKDNRKIETRVEFNESELKAKVPQGDLFLTINGTPLQKIEVEAADEAKDAPIGIENNLIKYVDVYFAAGNKRAYFGINSSGKSVVLIELTDNVTGGKEIEAKCEDHAVR